MKSNRLYNLLFPLWIILLFPPVWLVLLPTNFLMDTAVVLLTAKCLHMKTIGTLYKKSIVKVWLLGFAADIIGGLVALGVAFLPTIIAGGNANTWANEWIADPMMNNVWTSFPATLVTLLIMAGTGWLLYVFNLKISFKKLDIAWKEKKRLALSLAIFTAPYTLLVPSSLLYGGW